MKKYDGYALITGASSGIGLAFAKELAAKGYNLVIVSKDKPELDETEAMLKKDYKVKVISILKDLTDLDSADQIFKQLQELKVHVGLLINNAGFATSGFFHETDRTKLLGIIKIMCLTLTDLTYKFLPPMLEKGSGGIILTSSISAHIPFPLSSVYGASKGYTLNFGINLHAEYTGKGIDVLTVCPGFVDTNIFKEAKVDAPANIPFLTPKEIAQESLESLGKKIVITPTGKQWNLKIIMLLRKFISRQSLENITKKSVKESQNINL